MRPDKIAVWALAGIAASAALMENLNAAVDSQPVFGRAVMIVGENPARDAGQHPEADRLFAAFGPLLLAAPTAPSVAAVEEALGVQLVVLRDLQADGKTYGGDNYGTGWKVEYFINPTGRFNVEVVLGRASDALEPRAKIADWESLLVGSGWRKVSSISHPMILESFAKNSWEVRLEHDGIHVVRVRLLNL